jgi:hypothetical protein
VDPEVVLVAQVLPAEEALARFGQVPGGSLDGRDVGIVLFVVVLEKSFGKTCKLALSEGSALRGLTFGGFVPEGGFRGSGVEVFGRFRGGILVLSFVAGNVALYGFFRYLK